MPTDNASACSPHGRHDLTLSVCVEVPQNRVDVYQGSVDMFVVVSLSEVVAVAAALATAENLLARMSSDSDGVDKYRAGKEREEIGVNDDEDTGPQKEEAVGG